MDFNPVHISRSQVKCSINEEILFKVILINIVIAFTDDAKWLPVLQSYTCNSEPAVILHSKIRILKLETSILNLSSCIPK